MAKPALQPPKSGITVRMYNPGFGDCLLLAFRSKDDKPRYMLIDCGVHDRYPDREKKMQLVAKDIAGATGNRLHFVIATHAHTDHLYGFKYAREIFDKIKIDELWLAWTEDPSNETAIQLKQLYGIALKALRAAVHQLRLANAPLTSALQGLLDFDFPDDALAADTGGNAAQLDYLRARSKKKLLTPDDYRYPGETLALPNVKGIKVYILGPPMNVDWIKKLEKKSELYPEFLDMNQTTAFAAAALKAAGTPEDEQLFVRSCPFDKALMISNKKASNMEFFKEHYGFTQETEHGSEWRRIDIDWLAAAEQLALDINSKTNNTSLVLAIELTETEPRKVLLFAADAQVGNWLSWHELSWPGEEQDGERVTVTDLLERTVLYKVGHHGSQNATLSQKGLEMMKSKELVALIPVDQKWANEKMGWKHPAENLLSRIETKTRGRIIRTDDIPAGDKPPGKPNEAEESEWQAFTRQLDWDRSPNRLWIQYTVLG